MGNLIAKPPLLDCARGPPMTVEGKRVLLFATDLPVRGHVLGRDAHMAAAERIGQCGCQHVDHDHVAETPAEARLRQGKGRADHALGAAGHHDIGIAEHDHLGRADDRLEAAAAQAVEGHGRHFPGDGRRHRGHACEIHVPGFGMNHLAEDDMADIAGLDPAAPNRLGDDPRTQLRGRHAGKRSAKAADGGPHGAGKNNVAISVHELTCGS